MPRVSELARISEETFVATSVKPPKNLAAYWSAMLALGRFTVRDVLDKAGLGHECNAHLVNYVARLKTGGFVAEVARHGRTPTYMVARREDAPPQVQHSGERYEVDSALAVMIPRNEDGVWSVLKRLGKGGREVTAEAVHEAMQGALPVDAIADYLRRLAKGGYAELTGATPRNGSTVKSWRLTRLPAETPRLTLDGRPLKHAAQQDAMWKVIEMSAYFTAADLALHATTEECDVPLAVATEYAEHLLIAGYLIKRQQEGQDTLYRLLRHTGPMAPRLLRASFVFDPNKNCIYGPGQRVREVRR